MNTAYLLTGGNVGNRQQNLANAASLIEAKCGKIAQYSALYETAAWGKTDQPAFLNQALQLRTSFSADLLMQALLEIELVAGRKRTEKYGPRTIDIDILLFNHDIIQTPLVTVPHLQMANRRFVLEPLNEIASDYIHPVLKQTIAHLLAICPDKLPVKKFSGK
ncbi:MAG: 2-amino-4-hydroxy-6-hydroxymethyldihydropteridine diphosphokinase [Chitinophagaceae bacterium]